LSGLMEGGKKGANGGNPPKGPWGPLGVWGPPQRDTYSPRGKKRAPVGLLTKEEIPKFPRGYYTENWGPPQRKRGVGAQRELWGDKPFCGGPPGVWPWRPGKISLTAKGVGVLHKKRGASEEDTPGGK